MKKTASLIFCLVILSASQVSAQQFTATGYWKMENDPGYTMVLQRQTNGKTLTAQEMNYLSEYKAKLDDYFAKLSDNEKSLYYKNRSAWSQKPGTVDFNPPVQDAEVYSGEKSMYTRYLIQSGVFGLFYGVAADYVLGIEDNGVAAIPLLTAGASVLVPMLTIRDKNVSYNSLNLSLHGKGIGALQGAAFGVLLTGDNIEDGKLIVTLSTLSSIGLGRLGYSLGKNKPWSEGRVALYSHYGFLMPLEGLAIDAALGIEEPRAIAATSLLFGAGGYLIADRIANWNDFTKGDIISTQAFATLNALLGLSIMSDIADEDLQPSALLIPAIGGLGSTLVSHLWLKDAKFTKQQGRNTGLAALGGSVIGLGLAALSGSEEPAAYYLIGYATGFTSYAFLVHRFKNINSNSLTLNEKPGRWNVNFMPQNIILNRQLANSINSNSNKRFLLPAFSASVSF